MGRKMTEFGNRILINSQIIKRLFVMVLTFVFIVDVYPQQNLGPVIVRHDELSKAYYDSVFTLLHAGFTEKPQAQYTVFPSFSAEYALSVERKSDRYYLLSNIFSENYWYASYQNTSRVKVISKSIEIDSTFYHKIVELFNITTAHIKPQTKILESGGVSYLATQDSTGTFKVKISDEMELIEIMTDGETYYVATTDAAGNIIMGETRTPEKNTLMDRLIKISDDLYSLPFNIVQAEIEKRIQSLIVDMKKEVL
jgi:hypothetical protein